MAPEVIKGESYDNKIDIWAIGVIACELLTGHLPYFANNKETLFADILANEPNLEGGPKRMLGGGRVAKDFISKCLEKDPTKRPYAD